MGTICFDFGNTRLKAAVYDDTGLLIEVVTLENENDAASVQKLIDLYKPAKTILASVVNHHEEIEQLLTAQTKFHKISTNTQLNFTVEVGKKITIGADRLALVAAAVESFPKKNNLVIGLGSCITYNFVNQYHQFLGGAISPGMEMRFKSMHEYTSKLPLVEKDWNLPFIGYDTKTNLQSGVIFGIINEIEGFIEKYSQKYGQFNVVLTGGDAEYFARQLKNKIFADVNFLFKGLYALSEINN